MVKKIEKSNNTTRNLDRNLDRKQDINIKEGFDGIRKSNSRIIFTILLGIIILDFAYECMN
jgi:hypothetical protein